MKKTFFTLTLKASNDNKYDIEIATKNVENSLTNARVDLVFEVSGRLGNSYYNLECHKINFSLNYLQKHYRLPLS